MISSTSLNITWMTPDPDYSIIVAWTNLRTGMVISTAVAKNTSNYLVAEVIGEDDYSITVAANNSCGMKYSDPIIVHGKYICD